MILICMFLSMFQVAQEFVLGVFDAEVTADFNQNLSDVSTVKDPRSKDASQRYDFLNMEFHAQTCKLHS